MITSKDYIQWYKNEKRKMLDSGRYASEPTFLFKEFEIDEWTFNQDNWNGGDILRRGLLDILDRGINIFSYEIKYFRHDDQTTIFIFKDSDFYEISWYKSRGRTDIIKKNGEIIYLDEYIDLCNALNILLK